MLVKTDLRILFPYGFSGKLETHSSMAKKGIQVQGRVIDWDYCGEVIVMLYNFTGYPYMVNHRDKIAQLLLQPVPQPEIHHSTTYMYNQQYLKDTARGDKGFGHTGRHLGEVKILPHDYEDWDRLMEPSASKWQDVEPPITE